MSFLSRYSIRLSLLITLFIVVGSLFTLNYQAQLNQENLRLVEENRKEYGDRDTQILNYLDTANTELEKILKEQLTDIVNAYNGEIELNLVDTDPLRSALEQARSLLSIRQIQNYNISGLQLFLAFNLEIPEFHSIIDQSETGAFNSLEENRTEINNQIQFVSVETQLLRVDFSKVREQFEITRELIHESHEEYFNLTRQIINRVESDPDDSYAKTFLAEFGRLQNNVSQVLHRWSDLVETYLVSPLELDPPEDIVAINNIEGRINQSYNNLFALSLDPQDETLLTTHQDVVITDFMSNLKGNLDLMVNVTSIINDLRSLYTETFTQLSEDITSIVNSVTSTITEESAIFTQMIDNFIDDLRDQQTNATQTAFIVIISVITVVFVAFFITLTRGLGRILVKNERLAQGDLTVPLRDRYSRSEIGAIEESLDNLIVELRSILSGTSESAETLAGISEELAAGAEEASASINDVSATIREFSAGSSEQNVMLNRVRDNLITHLDVIEQTTNQIDETAKFVLKVAKRTNILGLNASIEAAKAGRFGLGFNVVAEEVRNLADDSRESAEQIADSIDDIEYNIQKTVQDILTEVNIVREVAENTAAGSEEASAATSEQVTMMGEISDTSAQLSEMSQKLNELMSRFKL